MTDCGPPAQTTPLPSLLRERTVVEQTGIPRGTLAWWRHQGTGPRFFKLGPRGVFYREEDVAEWLAAHYQRGKETDIA